jgi:uncharacterized membrane protein YphA (DoxX/SURF4 family)
MLVRAAFALFALSPMVALAHTRWFAGGDLKPFSTQEPTSLYLTVLALCAACGLALALFLERRGMFSLEFLRPRRDHAFSRASATLVMLAGAFFIVAASNNYLFAPVFTPEAGIPPLYILTEMVLGVMLLAGIFPRIAGIVLLGLWGLLVADMGLLMGLEHVWVPGVALFAAILGSDYFSLFPVHTLSNLTLRIRPWAHPILRIAAGMTLLVLGFSEKIFAPELGVHFLAEHPWNFMQLLGVSWYSDYLFTLSAGTVEAFLGLLLILGLLTRLTALITLGIFLIPMGILGPLELTGHLPHLSAIALLIFFGGGEKLRLPLRKSFRSYAVRRQ